MQLGSVRQHDPPTSVVSIAPLLRTPSSRAGTSCVDIDGRVRVTIPAALGAEAAAFAQKHVEWSRGNGRGCREGTSGGGTRALRERAGRELPRASSSSHGNTAFRCPRVSVRNSGRGGGHAAATVTSVSMALVMIRSG